MNIRDRRALRERNRRHLALAFSFLALWGAALWLAGHALAATHYGPYTLGAPLAIDGDTVRADVALWPDLIADVAIRVRGVDTPELHGATACERELAAKAKAFTDAWLAAHAPVQIEQVAPDKYAGRVDAVVRGHDGADLAAELIAAGLGRPYAGGQRGAWCAP